MPCLPSFQHQPPDSNQVLCDFGKSLFTFVLDEPEKKDDVYYTNYCLISPIKLEITILF